jgi:hypothetical protein
VAESPAHRFGQIIGDVLEVAVEPFLRAFAEQHGLFLDKQGPRPARRGQKVSWKDASGNTHDLDYVLERDGTPEKIGIPVAFIETAWRRYTKHSRNKAQEIQGAILPLAATHKQHAPFMGVVLGGVFTPGALTQLKSLGFTVLFFSYENVCDAFRVVGIDAHSDELTADSDFAAKVKTWESLSNAQRSLVADALIKTNGAGLETFMDSLTLAVTRQIERIIVLPLRGMPHELKTVDDAIAFVEGQGLAEGPEEILRFEIQILYGNGDKIEGHFADKQAAITFLNSYRTSTPPSKAPLEY